MAEGEKRALLIDPAGRTALTDQLYDFEIERLEPGALFPRLHKRGDVAAVLVASDLGGRSGVDFIKEVVEQGCAAPLILLAPDGDDALTDAALTAGAAAFIDLSRLEGRSLAWVIEFARANRRSVEQRNSRLLGSLASYLSHEGRNALAGIRGAVQVVSDHLATGDPDRALCEEIQRRVTEFSTSLDALSLVLRPMNEPGGCSYIALDQVIREQAARLPPGVEAKVSGEEMPVRANREQVAQLFSALLINAAEAMGNAGQVEVTLEREGDWCVASVVDSGPELDVSVADLSRMLDLFTTTRGLRAGLGLPVAKRIAEAHGGSLELSCSPARSLRVTVRLPLIKP